MKATTTSSLLAMRGLVAQVMTSLRAHSLHNVGFLQKMALGMNGPSTAPFVVAGGRIVRLGTSISDYRFIPCSVCGRVIV